MGRTKDQTHRSVTPVLASCRSMAILIVAAYVLINIILVALGPLTTGWPTWAVTALAVPPMVLAMVYIVIPIARRAQQA
jgi:antibiotic biosynthesis monooxygenase (ABM) superfamily enzyme